MNDVAEPRRPDDHPGERIVADRRGRQVVSAAARPGAGERGFAVTHRRIGRRRSDAGRAGGAGLRGRRHAARRRQRPRRDLGAQAPPPGGARHHPHRLRQHRHRRERGEARRGRLSRQAGRRRRRRRGAARASSNTKTEPPENPMSADRVRWEHIQRIYELCGRNVSETARRLNMHRRTLAAHSGQSARRAKRCAIHVSVRPVRIVQRLQAQRRGAREQQASCFARRRRQPMLGRLAHDFARRRRPPRSARCRAGKSRTAPPCEVAKNSRSQWSAVVLPFLVGAEIGDRRLDLDDPDFAARRRAPTRSARRPGRQRQFAHHARSRAHAAAARCRARPRARSPTGGRRPAAAAVARRSSSASLPRL